MSTTTHTPGPWLYRAKSNSIHAAPEAGAGHSFGRRIMQFTEDDNGECIESDADRVLVLASPKMLAALERFVAGVESNDVYPNPDDREKLIGILREANAAIAAAKGEVQS